MKVGMLNEKVDFDNLNITIAVITVLFLTVMWGGFYFFVRFKRRDDARRANFQKVVEQSEEKQS